MAKLVNPENVEKLCRSDVFAVVPPGLSKPTVICTADAGSTLQGTLLDDVHVERLTAHIRRISGWRAPSPDHALCRFGTPRLSLIGAV